MSLFVCQRSWPLSPAEYAATGGLIPFYALPQHECLLAADHGPLVPHRCHCGAEHDERDR